MAKQLSDLKTICQYHGWSDQTTAGLVQCTQFINDTLQILGTLVRWPEYNKVNGSVSCAATAKAFASIAGSGTAITITFATAHSFIVGDIIDVVGVNTDWSVSDVEITAVASLTVTYAGTTNTTTTTGTVTKHIEDTALTNTNLWRIGNLIRTDKASPLDELTHEEWLMEMKYHAATRSPVQYALRRFLDSAGVIRTRLLLYPKPTSTSTLYYTWQAYPKVLSSDSDYTDWPDTRMFLLTEALRVRLSAIDRDSGGVALYSASFMSLVNRAMNNARVSFMPIVVQNETINDWKTPLRRIEKTIV